MPENLLLGNYLNLCGECKEETDLFNFLHTKVIIVKVTECIEVILVHLSHRYNSSRHDQ